MFKSLFSAVKNALKGNSGFLNAACASAALAANADGSIEDAEIKAAATAVQSCKAITDNFSTQEIQMAINSAMTHVRNGSVGRYALWSEIQKVAEQKNQEVNLAILLIGIDVAASSDGIGEQEKTVLKRVADYLSLDLEQVLKNA